MKRWDVGQMREIGSKPFAKIHKTKYHAHHNHEIHFLAREIDEWLPQGIQAMADGIYTPRCLKRYYFKDEMVDQLHLPDRIFQHVLLKQLKPTFPYVMNKNCYHLHSPTGVKYATQRIRQILQEEKKFCYPLRPQPIMLLASTNFTSRNYSPRQFLPW